ncbi:hypothetical protein KM043_010074 [Ampulex compressa]|nr:hypothetical protein KM043_010074 [Ampulex compressa]
MVLTDGQRRRPPGGERRRPATVEWKVSRARRKEGRKTRKEQVIDIYRRPVLLQTSTLAPSSPRLPAPPFPPLCGRVLSRPWEFHDHDKGVFVTSVGSIGIWTNARWMECGMKGVGSKGDAWKEELENRIVKRYFGFNAERIWFEEPGYEGRIYFPCKR